MSVRHADPKRAREPCGSEHPYGIRIAVRRRLHYVVRERVRAGLPMYSLQEAGEPMGANAHPNQLTSTGRRRMIIESPPLWVAAATA